MAGTDTEEGRARPGRIRRLKKSIIFILVMAILIPTGVCVTLGIRYYVTHGKTGELQAQAQETARMYTAEAPDGDMEGADTKAGDDTDRYTADGVAVSKRDSRRGTEETAGPDPLPADGSIRKVYLTFDDGPSSNTGRILDILAEYGVKATFFVVGMEGESAQASYKRIVEEGHTLAMHSYTHKFGEIYQTVDSYAQDLSRLQEYLYDITGVWCRFCRFPGGSSNTVSRVEMGKLIDYLDEQDITYFDWNISSGDATGAYISEDAILRNCLADLPRYQESIILMHDASNKNTTVQALPALIESIQAMENTVIVPITEETEPIQHIKK